MPSPSARLTGSGRRQTERSNVSTMTGAMYAAIAGLRTHMQNLNVIGNNVANVNTAGYKSSRAIFKTSLYTTMTGGSDGTPVMGGTNPSQIGYGSNVSTIDIDMSTGNYNVTGKPTDCMLDGDGFFLVGDKEIADNFDGTANDVDRLTSLKLTRVGNFEFKADGYFANNDGNCVYGFLCVGKYGDENHPIKTGGANDPANAIDLPEGKKIGDPIFSDQLVPLRYPCFKEGVKYYKENADGTLEEVTAADALDQNGNLNAGFEAKKAKVIAYPTAGSEGVTDARVNTGTADAPVWEDLPRGKFSGISIDKVTGMISGTSYETGEVVTIGCIAVGLVTNPNGVTNEGDNYYKAGPGSGELNVAILGGNAEAMGITQVNASKYVARDANGNPDPNATVPVIDGLSPRTTETKCLSSGLEMSKTDLAQEIANMILTQRGYQANTRIITVTDSMLEELVNMKR